MELTNEKYKFAIVKFTEEDDALGIIALCWIQNNGTTCLYPPVTTDNKRNKLLRKEALPLQSWSSHKITLMKKYATYNDAREHLRKAEETSNLESEEETEVKRKRKAKDIMLPGEESSDEDYMPKKKSKTNRVTVHPYPSLDSFPSSFSSSSSTGMQVPEMLSSIPPISLSPRPSSFSNTKVSLLPSSFINTKTSFSPSSLSNTKISSTPLASPHCPSSPLSSVSSDSTRIDLRKDNNKTIKEKSASLDVERIWLILGQLQAAAGSQSEEISQLNRKMDLLLARGCVNSTSQEADESNEQALNSLPLSSMQEFDEFEEKLKKQEFKSLVVKLLATLGGKDAKLLMFNCMKRCLTSEIGMKFSYTGKPSKDKTKEKKRAFCSTLLCAAIQSSIRKIFSSTTEEQMKTNIGHWLQQSKNRGRTPRIIIPPPEVRD